MHYFAVTDQYRIMTLKVVHKVELDELVKIETAIVDENPSHHIQVHHKHYFQTLYLEDDGVSIDKSTVFTDLSGAQSYVSKKLTKAVQDQREKLQRLEEQLSEHQDSI